MGPHQSSTALCLDWMMVLTFTSIDQIFLNTHDCQTIPFYSPMCQRASDQLQICGNNEPTSVLLKPLNCHEPHQGFVFILFSLVPGFHTLTPRGALAFFAWHMHDWVSWLHIHTSHSLCFKLFLGGYCWCKFCFCFINAKQVSSVCVYLCVCVCVCVGFIFCVIICLSLRVGLYYFTPVGTPTLPCSFPQPLTVPLRPLPSFLFCLVSFSLRCSRRNSQTHSGVFTQSGHYT